MQKARAVGRENTVEVSILECDILPELQDIATEVLHGGFPYQKEKSQ
jgi:hypothetical protein